jgi:hypothetical protein
MQEAFGGWAPESHLSPAILGSLRELNARFLKLIGTQSGSWEASRRAGLPAGLPGQLAPLSAEQRSAAANCPYALFDMRFQDDGYWQTRLRDGARWQVADRPVSDDDTLNFVRLALFFAWHVASTTRLAPQLLLGMNEQTAMAFRRTTVDRLPALVVTEAANLTARWSHCPAYWSALVGAAARSNMASLRRVQLYGVQIAAAARLH